MAYYTKEMVMMKQLDPEAYAWLTDPDEPTRNHRHWCRFKPIITSFEEIRAKLMRRVAMRKEKMSKSVDILCPKPREILEKNKVKSNTDCIASGTGSVKVKVQSIGGIKYVVDLEKKSCACKRWDLTGIPCKHGVSAIHFMRMKPEDFVDPCYLRQTYMDTYTQIVEPLNDPNLWMPSGQPPIQPPLYNRQPGMPTKKRKRNASENETTMTKLSRKGKQVKCNNCQRHGHNMKSRHMHLPPKESVTKTTKRKLNTGKAKKSKDPPKTKNQLREKARKRVASEREKREKQRAAAGNTAPTRVRPPTAPSNNRAATASYSQATRSCVRIRTKGKGK